MSKFILWLFNNASLLIFNKQASKQKTQQQKTKQNKQKGKKEKKQAKPSTHKSRPSLSYLPYIPRCWKRPTLGSVGGESFPVPKEAVAKRYITVFVFMVTSWNSLRSCCCRATDDFLKAKRVWMVIRNKLGPSPVHPVHFFRDSGTPSKEGFPMHRRSQSVKNWISSAEDSMFLNVSK